MQGTTTENTKIKLFATKRTLINFQVYKHQHSKSEPETLLAILAVLSLASGEAGRRCAGEGERCRNDADNVRGSFQETAPRKTTENTVQHRNGGGCWFGGS